VPKELTHIVFADKVAAALPGRGRGRLAGRLDRSRDLYRFGAIAPDTLFYEVLLPGLDRAYRPWGDLIHGEEGEDTGRPIVELLSRLRAGAQGCDADGVLAFACGFLTHMALDATFHPWVYSVSGQYYDPDPAAQADARARHRLVEAWLDLWVAGREPGGAGSGDPAPRSATNGPANSEVLDAYGRAFRAAWRIDADVCAYLRRFYRVQVRLVLLFPKAGLARRLAALDRASRGRMTAFVALFHPPADAPVPDRIGGLRGFVHPVTGDWVAGGLEAMFGRAETLALGWLEAADAFLEGGSRSDLAAALGGLSLNLGLPDCPTSAARYFDPLPLEVLWPWGRAA
jgi:hypothetical protein